MEILQKAGELLTAIRKKRPLVHHITNYVTMNDCANIVLAAGGSPIMANDLAEAAEVTAAASALVINMGTPDDNKVEAMAAAGKIANEKGIPIVFDPVGAGMTSFRRAICSRILKDIKPDVIRGNMGEILYLSGVGGCLHGVDYAPAGSQSLPLQSAADIAKNLARSLGCIIALTGKTDIVTDGSTVYLISNGDEMLSRVTGTGCMTSSLVGAFCAGCQSLDLLTYSRLQAAAAGVMAMGIAGQLAKAGITAGEGIGTFKVKLFDNIYSLSGESFTRYGSVEAFTGFDTGYGKVELE